MNAPSQHPVPADLPDAARWSLVVDGLVEHSLHLTLEALQALPFSEHRGSFTCEVGWKPGSTRWQGASLGAVFALAGLRPEATAFYAHAPGFRSLVPLDCVTGALLAYQLDSHPLTLERGAPCRLIVPDRGAPLSVKWLARLEVFRREPHQPVGPRKP